MTLGRFTYLVEEKLAIDVSHFTKRSIGFENDFKSQIRYCIPILWQSADWMTQMGINRSQEWEYLALTQESRCSTLMVLGGALSQNRMARNKISLRQIRGLKAWGWLLDVPSRATIRRKNFTKIKDQTKTFCPKVDIVAF